MNFNSNNGFLVTPTNDFSVTPKNGVDMVIKILMIGDSNVGKSCLLLRYVDNSYSPTFITTIGIDFKVKVINVEDKRIKLQLWDTAGQERFRTITTSYFRGAQAAMLTYDVTNRETFDHIKSWLDDLHQHGNGKIEVFLVANKIDLLDSRLVTKEEGEQLAKKYKMTYFECSARSGLNVDEMFHQTASIIYNKINNQQLKKSIVQIHKNVNTNINKETKKCCY